MLRKIPRVLWLIALFCVIILGLWLGDGALLVDPIGRVVLLW